MNRLHGLDLARFFALFGMVVVNFKVASGAISNGGLLPALTNAFEGRAAATFVVLAGIGLGLARPAWAVTLKRAAFLMGVGLLDMLIFDADIIHYYAVYFVIGAMFLRLETRALVWAIPAIILLALTLLLTLNFDTGWNWETYSYADFWTLPGFARHLLFNGWHPVLPWMAFLLLGLLLARADLSSRAVQLRLTFWGLRVWVIGEVLSALLQAWFADYPEAVILFQTAPVPPVPLYMLAGAGAACSVIGASLLLGNHLKPLAVTGRQTLTLYFAHIYVGMGLMQAFGLLDHPPLWAAMLAVLAFVAAAIVFANLWSRRFARGPIESIMRYLCG